MIAASRLEPLLILAIPIHASQAPGTKLGPQTLHVLLSRRSLSECAVSLTPSKQRSLFDLEH